MRSGSSFCEVMDSMDAQEDAVLLGAIADEHRAKAAADAEKNGEAPADQVN